MAFKTLIVTSVQIIEQCSITLRQAFYIYKIGDILEIVLPESAPLLSNMAKMEMLIHMLTVLIKIGKYLPLIVLTFAMLNLILAVLDFLFWNNIAGGIFNSILSIAGFNFFVQLVKRRKVHRYEYQYSGRHRRGGGKSIEEEVFAQKDTAAASA